MRPARREVAEPDPRPEPTETLEVIGDDTADIEYLIAYTGHRYRYNTLAERDELWYSDRADWSSAEHEPWAIPPLRGDDTRWEPATDDHWDSIRTIGETCFRFPKNHPTKNKRHQPWTTTDQVWKRRIGSIRRQAHRRVNPIAEWVDKQPSDDPNLIEQMLHVVLGVPDTPLNRWVSWRIFMTAIHRLRNPQARLPHEILILKGGEGTFKTLLIQNLLPVPEWVGSFSMDDNEQKMAEAFLGSLFAEWGEMATAGRYNNRHTKDMLTRQAIKVRLAWGRHPIAESLKGRVIVEIAEMVGSTRADIERLKAFLTRTNDGQHRGAWARHAESAPRQSIFIGTTNDPKCLPNDPTGNRRFVPITLGPALDAVEPYLEANLLQLWAEAVYKHHRPDDYPDWRTARLPRSLFAQQRALNDEHRAANVIIADALDTLNIDKDLWLITEIADEIDLDLKNRAANATASRRNSGGYFDTRPIRASFPRDRTPIIRCPPNRGNSTMILWYMDYLQQKRKHGSWL